MKQIWIVVGNNGGSYEDYREWDVAAYLEEELAKKHTVLLNDRIAEICKMTEEEILEKSKLLNPYDDDMFAEAEDFRDISYSYGPVNAPKSPEEYSEGYEERKKYIWISPTNYHLNIDIRDIKDIQLELKVYGNKYRQVAHIIFMNNYEQTLLGYLDECANVSLGKEIGSLIHAWESYRNTKNEELDVDEYKLLRGEYCCKTIPGCFCAVGWPIERTCPNCRNIRKAEDRNSYCCCAPKGE